MSKHYPKPPPLPIYRKLDRAIIVVLSALLCISIGWGLYSYVELRAKIEVVETLKENRTLCRETLDAVSDQCEQIYRLGEAYRITLASLMRHLGLTADAPAVAVLDAYRRMTLIKGTNVAIGGGEDGKTDVPPAKRVNKRHR